MMEGDVTNFEKSLEIVVLQRPYDIFEHESVQKVFSKMIDLKLVGYKKEYGYGVLPIDTFDFIGTNLLICLKKDNGERDIICGYKSISTTDCEDFDLDFPPFNILNAYGSNDCLEKTKAIVERNKKDNHIFSYDCSWTASPKIRSNKELMRTVMELTMAIGVLFHEDYAIPEWMTCGIPRFRTDKFFHRLGLQNIGEDAYFKHPSLVGEDAIMVHLEENSEEAVVVARKWKSLWESRVELSRASFERGENLDKAS